MKFKYVVAFCLAYPIVVMALYIITRMVEAKYGCS